MANETASNVSNMSCTDVGVCYRPENSLLYLVLMLGTLWLGITLYHFEKSLVFKYLKMLYVLVYIIYKKTLHKALFDLMVYAPSLFQSYYIYFF